MKRFLFEYFPAWLLLVVFTFIVIHAPLTVYVGSHFPELATIIKGWKEVLIAIAALLVGIKMTMRGQWRTLRYDYLGWAILGFWGIHIGSLAWSGAAPEAMLAGLLIDLRYTVFAAAIYHFLILYPRYRQSFLRVGVVGAVIVLGFAVMQLFLPADILRVIGYSESTIAPYLTVDKNPDFIRYSSTLRGPNPLGAYAIIVLSVAAAFLVSRRHMFSQKTKEAGLWALTIAGAVALWVSYSRSALVACIMAIALVLIVKYGGTMRKQLIIGSSVLIVLASIGLFAARDTNFVQNVILHNNPTTGAEIDSNSGHISSLQEGLMRVGKEPLGAGVGSTGSASLLGDEPFIIENQYLMIAHEVGVIGLVFFLVIYITFLHRIWLQRRDWVALGVWASGIGLGLVGLLLPVWADDTVSLVWWGLAALVLAAEHRRGNVTPERE
jgi:hypothetical protein